MENCQERLFSAGLTAALSLSFKSWRSLHSKARKAKERMKEEGIFAGWPSISKSITWNIIFICTCRFHAAQSKVI